MVRIGRFRGRAALFILCNTHSIIPLSCSVYIGWWLPTITSRYNTFRARLQKNWLTSAIRATSALGRYPNTIVQSSGGNAMAKHSKTGSLFKAGEEVRKVPARFDNRCA